QDQVAVAQRGRVLLGAEQDCRQARAALDRRDLARGPVEVARGDAAAVEETGHCRALILSYADRMAKRARLDNLLVERGLFATRSKAAAAVMAGIVLVDGKPALKA